MSHEEDRHAPTDAAISDRESGQLVGDWITLLLEEDRAISANNLVARHRQL
jgi:hypothetical protein